MEINNLLIYQETIIKTYLYFIKENFKLITNILEEKKKFLEPYDLNRDFMLYIARAKHLQIMSLVGITAEHLLKVILLKRGNIINVGISSSQFSKEFLQKIINYNNEYKNKEKLDNLYGDALKNINIQFKDKLIRFEECIKLFIKSNPTNYFTEVGTYLLNQHPEDYNGNSYLGYQEIKPELCLRIIRDSRNSYLHKAEAKSEQNGVVWYLFNFLVWISKKEYPDFFKEENFIGSEDSKNLFN